jgi:hypothetical protein
MFAGRGFSILSPMEQFNRYGRSLPLVWMKMSHTFDIGHFLWAKPAATRPDNPILQWWGMVILNSLFLLLALWRSSGFTAIDGTAYFAIPSSVLLLFGFRWLAMKLAARAQGLRTRYRAWETGLLVTFVIALVFGGQFPVPGNIYPTSNDWSYRQLLPKLSQMALAGIVAVLLLLFSINALLITGNLSGGAAAWLNYARYVGTPLALFDVVLAAIFPFVSFNGRRIWEWNRPLWFVLSLVTVGLFFV